MIFFLISKTRMILAAVLAWILLKVVRTAPFLAHQQFVFTKFTGLQMFTSDEKSYEEKDEVVVHSISVKIFELSAKEQLCDSQPRGKISYFQTKKYGSLLFNDYYCRSKKEVLEYINRMNRAAKVDFPPAQGMVAVNKQNLYKMFQQSSFNLVKTRFGQLTIIDDGRPCYYALIHNLISKRPVKLVKIRFGQLTIIDDGRPCYYALIHNLISKRPVKLVKVRFGQLRMVVVNLVFDRFHHPPVFDLTSLTTAFIVNHCHLRSITDELKSKTNDLKSEIRNLGFVRRRPLKLPRLSPSSLSNTVAIVSDLIGSYFICLQMFTSDEKSYEEEDETVVHSISVMIVEFSCQGQSLDLKQTWSSTLVLEESERSAGHVDRYYIGTVRPTLWVKEGSLTIH
ncbi:hypothetical protein ACSBR1_033416 [Camellia fascicularis]